MRLIGTVQVGISALGVGRGALGEPTFRRLFARLVASAVSIGLALMVTTYLYVVLGELMPKAIALDRAETVAEAPRARCQGTSHLDARGTLPRSATRPPDRTT